MPPYPAPAQTSMFLPHRFDSTNCTLGCHDINPGKVTLPHFAELVARIPEFRAGRDSPVQASHTTSSHHHTSHRGGSTSMDDNSELSSSKVPRSWPQSVAQGQPNSSKHYQYPGQSLCLIKPSPNAAFVGAPWRPRSPVHPSGTHNTRQTMSIAEKRRRKAEQQQRRRKHGPTREARERFSSSEDLWLMSQKHSLECEPNKHWTDLEAAHREAFPDKSFRTLSGLQSRYYRIKKRHESG